jgi:hypothetical protein
MTKTNLRAPRRDEQTDRFPWSRKMSEPENVQAPLEFPELPTHFQRMLWLKANLGARKKNVQLQ